jgi:hypothetical protein
MTTATAEGLRQRESSVDGVGVFAERTFQPGNVIARIVEYESFGAPRRGSVQLTPTVHVIDPAIMRWVNHSCIPNIEIVFDGQLIELRALRMIPAGEELLCDYLNTEDSIPVPFPCRCGNCGGEAIRGRSSR